MSVALKNIEGVESVEVSLEKASAVIRLEPDNKVTLPLLRRAIRSNGYTTREAHVVARGRIVERDATSTLDLLNGSVLVLAERPPEAAAGTLEVTGVAREDAQRIERLTVTAVKPVK